MKNYTAEHDKYILNTYKRNKLLITKAKGKYVWDNSGKKYLDFFSGLSVVNVGHSNPRVVEAVKDQSEELMHVSNLYYTLPQINLAKILSSRTLGGKVFFCNSGAEAVETALKISRKFGTDSGGGKDEIISFINSFHGRTLGALSVTGQEKFQQFFKPLLPGIKFAEYNNEESVKKALSEKTAAIIVEPIQGEAGVYPAAKEFLVFLRKICDEKKVLLIFDEVQCGMGRTGKFCAYQHYGVVPDVICFAKSLGGGLPLGACVVGKHLDLIFSYGDHGSTFGGNPVACAAGIEVVKQLNDKMLKNVQDMGGCFLSALNELAGEFEIVKEVRGMGLMLAMELYKPGADFVALAQNAGLLINCTHDYVVRFLPPFIINRADIDCAISILRDILKKY